MTTPSVSERRFVVQSSTTMTMEIDSVTAKALAQKQSFFHNVEYAIAASLGWAQQDVQVLEIIIQGRRLMEDDDTGPGERRLKSSNLNIKYAVFLANLDDVKKVQTTLSTESSRASFAQTLGVELSEKERSQGRGNVVSNVYISSAMEVEKRSLTNGIETRKKLDEDSVSTMSSVEDSSKSEAPAEYTITETPTTTQEEQFALAGGACTSQCLCWYGVLVIALSLGKTSLF